MFKIMIIRHAEKHQHGNHQRGIAEDGSPSHHELTVRGWERAAALVHLFAPAIALPKGSAIETPRAIFASNATKESRSLRAMHTAKPLAEALGIAVNHDYAENEEFALMAALSAAPSPVLIVWHHGHIARLVRQIAGDDVRCPAHWPDDRFDVVWILERHGAGAHPWKFSQVPQLLFADDCPTCFD